MVNLITRTKLTRGRLQLRSGHWRGHAVDCAENIKQSSYTVAAVVQDQVVTRHLAVMYCPSPISAYCKERVLSAGIRDAQERPSRLQHRHDTSSPLHNCTETRTASQHLAVQPMGRCARFPSVYNCGRQLAYASGRQNTTFDCFRGSLF